MQFLTHAELVEEEEEEYICFTDQNKNTISLPLTNFVPKYEERALGRKLSTIVLTESSDIVISLLNELFEKKELYHKLQNELAESSSFWIRNFSSMSLQVSSSQSSPVHVKRRMQQPKCPAKKSKGEARTEELSNKWSLEKIAESSWCGFVYLEVNDINVDEYDLDNTARLVKEISLQLDPGKLIVNVAAYGPPVKDVPKINQQSVGQFDFKALSSKDALSAAKQIQDSGGHLKYFPGDKVLASVYRLDPQSERNVEQYIKAKEQFVTEGIQKKLTNQDWVKLCIEGREMFEDTADGDTHIRRLLTSFDIWSKHQIDTVVHLVNRIEGPLLHQVLKMISNFEVLGLTPSENQIRKRMLHNLSFEHLRLMSQTDSSVLRKLLLLIKNQELDLTKFKEEMKDSIIIEKLKSVACHILKSGSFKELEMRFGEKVGPSVLMKYREAVVSIKGAPNQDFRLLETYLNQLDHNIIPHTVTPQFESFVSESEFSEQLKAGIIDSSALVIVNMEGSDESQMKDIMHVVEVLSCQDNFTCIVVSSVSNICLLQVHLSKIYSDFRPVLLTFERSRPLSLDKVWKEDKQYGLFFSNSVEIEQAGSSIKTNFNSTFTKALTMLTERFSRPGQKLTFMGLPGNQIHVPKNISSLMSKTSNRILFFGSVSSVAIVAKKVGKMSEDSEVGDEVNEEDDVTDMLGETVMVDETQEENTSSQSESLFSNKS